MISVFQIPWREPSDRRSEIGPKNKEIMERQKKEYGVS